jgi:hypothetical protein
VVHHPRDDGVDFHCSDRRLLVMELRQPTRKQYMDHEVTHHDYYKAVARTAGICFPQSDFVTENRVNYILHGDKHLNMVPLARWDSFAHQQRPVVAPALKAHGDVGGWSLSSGVCVVKAAMVEAIMLDGKGAL